MKRRKIRKISIRAKILLPVVLIIVVLCVVMGLNSYMRSEEDLVAMGVEEAEMAASISSKVIDGTMLSEMTAEKAGSEEYDSLLSSMRQVRDDCGIKYMYTLYTDGKKVYYGIDTDESENARNYGEEFESSYGELREVFEGKSYVQDYIDSTGDGDLISAYMPVRDKDEKIVAIVGCDYDASAVVKRLDRNLPESDADLCYLLSGGACDNRCRGGWRA